MTMTSSLKSTSRGSPKASLLLITLSIHDRVMKDAQPIDTSMGGASQNMFCARKHSGMIHAMNGWKKVVRKTFTMRSIERGQTKNRAAAAECRERPSYGIVRS